MLLTFKERYFSNDSAVSFLSLQQEKNMERRPTSWWLFKKGCCVICYTVYITALDLVFQYVASQREPMI